MSVVRPKKHLGQHFLKHENIASRIADTIDGYPDLPVIEVGPGTGMLTQFLIAKERDLKVVEIDLESIEYLNVHFPELEGRIIEQNFLTLNFEKHFDGPICIIGNYPYNISSQIFFKVVDNRDLVPCCTGMIQKEVAERMTASPGSKTYGILTVLLQAWYDIEYLFTVNEGAFNPPPRVKSAVVRLTRNDRQELNCNESLFKLVVKSCFNQRRKMIRNSVRALIPKGVELPDNPLLTQRPEQLSIAQFEELTNYVEEVQNSINKA